MTIRWVFTVLTIFLATTAQAQVVYEQMATDFQALEQEIQALDVNENDSDKLGFQVVRSNARVLAFRLQGVLRLLTRGSQFKKSQSETIDDLFSEIKSLEDVIGKMDEATSVLKTAKKRLEEAIEDDKSKKKINDLREKVKKLEAKAQEQSKYVGKVFKKSGWLKAGVASERTSELHFLQYYSGDEELKMISTLILSEYAFFQKKIRSELIPKFKNAKFSHDSMEYNFHEFRRLVRWASIYLQSLPKVFSLSPYSTEGLSSDRVQILEDYRDYKYAQIESSDSPIIVDRYTFYHLAHFVKLAGDSKDVAEKHFKALENGLDSELDEDQFKKDMTEIMEGFLDARILDTLSDNLSL